jgi:hypothetical protein
MLRLGEAADSAALSLALEARVHDASHAETRAGDHVAAQ